VVCHAADCFASPPYELAEPIANTLLKEKTGLDFKPLQNASGNGCDGCAIDVSNKTIWVSDAKSSVNGVDAAAVAEGSPRIRLDGWLGQKWANEGGNQAFTQAMQQAIKDGYQVKGITAQVGVPKLGTTGTVEVRFIPWN